MKSGIKAIFFDIGGTLMEKKPLSHYDDQKLEEMLSLLQVGWTSQELEETIRTGAQAYKSWCEQTLNELTVEQKWAHFLLAALPEEKVRPIASRLQWLWSQSKTNKQIKMDALETLRELSRRGYLLGTISHSNPIYLDQPEFSSLLKVRIYAQEYGKRKPHPSLFIDAARHCDLNPEIALMLGIILAGCCGTTRSRYGKSFWVKNGYGGMDSVAMQPDRIVQDLAELLMVFRNFRMIPTFNRQAGERDRFTTLRFQPCVGTANGMTATEFFQKVASWALPDLN